MIAGIRKRLTRRSSTTRRRRRTLLISAAGVLAFLVALLLWVGNDPASNVAIVPLGPSGGAATPTSSPPPSASPSTSTSPAKAAAHSDSGVSGGSLVLPPFPNNSVLDPAPHGVHSVTFVVTSDKSILQLVYAVRGGNPPNGYRTYIESPLTITETAHGDGIVGEIAAQASPGATTTTCSIYVDGVLASTHSAKGPFAVAFCVG